MLGGFVNGLTGAGVGALWDGGHCFCEHGEKSLGVVQKHRSSGGYIRSVCASGCQSQFCEILPSCRQQSVMVKIGFKITRISKKLYSMQK